MSLAATLEYLARLLAELDVPWAVAGALAANAYRLEVRTTTDIDLLVDLMEPSYGRLARRLEAEGWSVRAAGGERLGFPDIARLRHDDHFPVDLLLAKTPYQTTAIRRARVLDSLAPGLNLPYLSPEDVVIHKLIAYRFRDRDDLESLIRAGVELDEAYVDRWCDEWEIRDRWEELKRARP